MKCCENKNKKNFKSISMLGLCCLAPFIITFLMSILGINSASTKLFSLIPFLICPLMMGFMIFILLKPSKNSKGNNN